MRILWIEDGEDISVENYFGSKVFHNHEIDPIINHSKDNYLFDCAHDFIANHLERYDYIIIDIDLSNSEIKKGGNAEEIMNRLEPISKDEFLEAAGFDLYIQLMERGFPKERIIFFSANAGSALGEQEGIVKELISAIKDENKVNFEIAYKELKHTLDKKGEKDIEEAYNSKKLLEFCKELLTKIKEELANQDDPHTFQKLEEQFYFARIEIPNNAISKNNPKRLDRWFESRLNFDKSGNEHENLTDTKNYLTLRRGMMNVIESLEDSDSKLTKRFEDQIDKSAFLDGLRWLIQPHFLEPKQAGKFYLILCDYMTKPFESIQLHKLKNEPKKFDADRFQDHQTQIKSWIEDRSNMIPAKFMRNWIAHGLITGSENTPKFTAYDACFTFLIVIKSLFGKKPTGDKGDLNRLFGDLNQSFKAITGQVVKFHKSTYATSQISDKLDQIETIGDKRRNSDPGNKSFWKKQNFLFHFYASCLLASAYYIRSTTEDKNQTSEEKYTVSMTYELQNTSFIKIASKRIQELAG